MKKTIDQANMEAVGKMITSDPVWMDVLQALEAVPGMEENKILYAGPPISWEAMCKPQQDAVIGAMIYEGLANSHEEALTKLKNADILLDSNHNHACVNPMTGVMSASMPVFVVENKTHRNLSFSLVHEGYSHRRLAMGVFDDKVIENLRWIEQSLAPALRAAVLQTKGIKLKPIMTKALAMGDELHNRNIAATCLLLREIAPLMNEAGLPSHQVSKTLRFLKQTDNFFLSLAMASAKAAADASHGIQKSTLVTAMTRNGVEFGIRVSGVGSEWFTGPAQPIRGSYLAGYSSKDASYDMGDSAIMETVGLGAFAMAASPEMALAAGGTPEEAIEWSNQMRSITVTTNKEMKLPWVAFTGTPTGIDIRKVVELNVLPIIDTAIAHSEGGFIGVGVVEPPMECFKKALLGLARSLAL
jgi:hypothetical protein